MICCLRTAFVYLKTVDIVRSVPMIVSKVYSHVAQVFVKRGSNSIGNKGCDPLVLGFTAALLAALLLESCLVVFIGGIFLQDR